MMKLHCDQCDAVIESEYYTVQRCVCGSLTNAFNKEKTLCSTCYNENIKTKRDSDEYGACECCKYYEKEPNDEPCIRCMYRYFNQFKPNDGGSAT